MKLSAFKAFLPSKYLLAVALVLGLATLWYLQLADEQADHIVRRNFNHLNQITANIETVHEGLTANIFFECERVLEYVAGSTGPGGQGATLAKIRGFYDRWANDSILVKDQSRIDVAGSPSPVNETGTVQCGGKGPRDSRLLMQAGGTNLVAGGLESRFMLSFIHRQVEPAVSFLVTVKQDFELVSGLDYPEGYFDTILLGAYEAGGGRVYHNSATATSSVPEDDIRALFNATHDYARFSSLGAFARATRITELQLADLAGDAPATAAGSSDESWNKQSRLLSIPLDRDEKVAFSQPLTLSFIDSRAPVIIGLMESGEFNRLKYRLPLNIVLFLVVSLLAGILLLSFLRLSLLPKHAVLRRHDVVLTLISLVGLALLTTVFFTNLLASREFNKLYRNDLHSIHAEIRTHFYDERKELLGYLHGVMEAQAARHPVTGENSDSSRAGTKYELLARHPVEDGDAGRDDGRQASRCSTGDMTTGDASSADNSRTTWTRQCGTGGLPLFTDIFLLDEEGAHIGSFVTHDDYDLKPGFDVSSREYYAALDEGRNWYLEADGHRHRYYMERIETLSDGALETGISLKIPSIKAFCQSAATAIATDTCENLNPAMLVGTTQLYSLDFTVLPPGFGFAVFDRYSGDVLYHSDARRSRRENFYRATDDAPELKAAVISNLDAELALSYKGHAIATHLSPLRGTDWVLVSYYDKSLVDVVNFRFSAAAFGLASLVLIGIPLAVALVVCLLVSGRAVFRMRVGERLVSRSYPHWLYPSSQCPQTHRNLGLYYAILLWVYIGVIFYLDLWPGFIWLGFVLLLSPLMWYLLQTHAMAQPGRLTPGRFTHRLSRGRPPFAWLFTTLLLLVFALLVPFIPEASRPNAPRVILVAAIIGVLGVALLVAQHRVIERGAGSGPPRRDAADTGFNYAALAWYRLQLCLFLLLVSVVPAIQFYNESYDVHQRLWLDFHGWAVGNRLAARSHAIQDYTGSLKKAEAFRLDETLFGGEAMHGFYLPRTRLINRESGAGNVVLDTRPQALRDPGKINPAVVEGSVYAITPERLSRCHPHGDNDQRQHAPEQSRQRIDNFWVHDAARQSPAFSTIGTLLRQFIDVDQHASRHAYPAPAPRDDCEVDTQALYFVDYLDERRQTLFVFDYYFPHTRAFAPLTILTYLGFVLVAVTLLMLFLGFIMRRILLCRELETEPAWPQDRPVDPETAPLALLVPAHRSMGSTLEALKRELLAKVRFPDARFTALQDGLLWVLHDPGILIVTDFFALIGDRYHSDGALSHIDKARDDNYAILVLSDVVPAYWLKHRHGARAMPDSEFARWERLLRQLPCYRYDHGDMARPVAVNYRRAWDHSSRDERLALGALYYEGLVHTRNRNTLQSLVNRGLLRAENHHLVFDPAMLDAQSEYHWGQFLHDNLPLGDFIREAKSYQTSVWRAFRGPVLLALLALLGFLAYIAQDELRTVLSLLAALGAATAALAGVGERLRAFQEFFSGGGGD